ncbi:MAG: hypothetical protein M1816_002469 [Peltula sp. TS41687]|nr:MAG: hypothetical protein M1816_002469 [Peltula sp. TS41687]
MRTFKFLSGVIYLFTFTSSVHPTPTNLLRGTFPRDGKLVEREDHLPLPSVSECKDHLNVAKDTSLFYSGPFGYAKRAKDWAKSKNNGYKLLSQQWTESGWPAKWQYTELSAGTVYVMLPADSSGTNWPEKTVWDRVE